MHLAHRVRYNLGRPTGGCQNSWRRFEQVSWIARKTRRRTRQCSRVATTFSSRFVRLRSGSPPSHREIDCAAEDAVRCEPVSPCYLGKCRVISRKCREKRIGGAPEASRFQWVGWSPPYSTEQGDDHHLAARCRETNHRYYGAPVHQAGRGQFRSWILQSNALLPLVDSEFHLVECRRARLDAYARGLLQHLDRIRDGGKAGGYPVATIKAAAVWLIESYAEARVAPAPEAALLIRKIVSPNESASTSPVRKSSERAYLAAIEFEAGHRPDPKGKNPSGATLYAVARHVRPKLQNKHASQKTAEGTVRAWRCLPHYQENVALQRPRHLRVKS
jgi:hypothetical protein